MCTRSLCKFLCFVKATFAFQAKLAERPLPDQVAARNVTEEMILDYMVQKQIRSLYNLKPKAFALADKKVPAETNPERIFFFTHHKTGTVLSMWIAHLAAVVLNQSDSQYGREGTENASVCSDTFVATLANLSPGQLATLQAECPNFRAVHVIREAGALVASGYLYHSRNPDVVPGVRPGFLRDLSLDDGLRAEARAELATTIPEMVQTYALTKDLENVLIVRLESFEENFDGTTRKMFEFLLGASHPKIDALVESAAEADVARWSTTEKQNNDHVADEQEEHEVVEELLKLRTDGDETVRRVYGADVALGFNPFAIGS